MTHHTPPANPNSEQKLEQLREVLEAVRVLRDEASGARDRTEDLTQASYWSGRANAFSEVISRIEGIGL